MAITEWVLEHDLKLDVNQGMDLRLIDEDIAARVMALRWWGQPTFALDMAQYVEQFSRGADILLAAGMRPGAVKVFIYCHDEVAIPDARRRWEIVRSFGFEPFLMMNRGNITPTLRRIRRRGTRPAIWRNLSAAEVFA